LHGVGAANAGAKFHETSGNRGKTWENMGKLFLFEKNLFEQIFFEKKKYGKNLKKNIWVNTGKLWENHENI